MSKAKTKAKVSLPILRKAGLVQGIIISLLVVIVLILPVIKSNLSLRQLKATVSPEIYTLASVRTLNDSHIDQIIATQVSYPYSIARPPCNPEIYDCSFENQPPTQEELNEPYYLEGPMYSEFTYTAESYYRGYLEKLFSENTYHYHSFQLGCDDENDLLILFTSEDKQRLLAFEVFNNQNGTQKQFDIFLTSSIDNLKSSCY